MLPDLNSQSLHIYPISDASAGPGAELVTGTSAVRVWRRLPERVWRRVRSRLPE